MLIEQIHFPATGTNWNKIAIGAIVILAFVTVVYVAAKRPKYTPKPKPKDDVA